MNPIYAIRESRHRWLILAGITLAGGCLGAMMMLAYVWPHLVARLWLIAGLALSLYFLVRATLEWEPQVEQVDDGKAEGDTAEVDVVQRETGS